MFFANLRKEININVRLDLETQHLEMEGSQENIKWLIDK